MLSDIVVSNDSNAEDFTDINELADDESEKERLYNKGMIFAQNQTGQL